MEREKERSEGELPVVAVVEEMKGWLKTVMGILALRIGFSLWWWWVSSWNLRESFISSGYNQIDQNSEIKLLIGLGLSVLKVHRSRS